MKLSLTILSLLFASVCALPAVDVTGVRQVGYGGINSIGGQDFWWFCFEPNGSGALANGQTVSMNLLTVSQGWTMQNTERADFFNNNPGLLTTAVPRQIAVMQYVMDTFLPWSTLAGASGQFTEQVAATSGVNPNDTNPMYDALLAIQYFGSEMYGKVTKDDFTQFNDFVAPNFAAQGFSTDAVNARNTIYNNILNDVSGKAASFFDSYLVQHEYFIANTFFSEVGPTNNMQDGIYIGVVPEPSGALLIGAVGLLVTIRRVRKRQLTMA